MRKKTLILLSILMAVAAIYGCTKKTDQTATMTSADSLVATNPTEQAPGNLTPGQAPEESPPPAPVQQSPRPRRNPPSSPPRSEPRAPVETGTLVPSGTGFNVVFSTDVSSENAKAGDGWTGTLKEAVIVGDRVVFPAGAVVHGVVRDAKPAVKGDRAMLDLAVTGIETHGEVVDVEGGTEPIVAGSTRARNLGAIAGGAAAGAILGKVVSGSNKGAVVGGVLGGVAGHVLTSRHSHVELRPGTELSFLVNEQVALR